VLICFFGLTSLHKAAGPAVPALAESSDGTLDYPDFMENDLDKFGPTQKGWPFDDDPMKLHFV